MSVTELRVLQERMQYEFRDEEKLRLALTHPSMAHEQRALSLNNQRLEYLGDAVLQLVIAAELYVRFPEAGEGPLTKARAHLVNRLTLATLGERLRLGDYLLLSRGEETSGGRNRVSTLADTFEAVVGALYLDGGLEEAKAFILRLFSEPLGSIGTIPNLDNPKGELQEKLQAHSNEAPQYRLESVTGPDHERQFVSVVHHLGEPLGRGEGRSKKEAESQAARAALTRLQNHTSPPS